MVILILVNAKEINAINKTKKNVRNNRKIQIGLIRLKWLDCTLFGEPWSLENSKAAAIVEQNSFKITKLEQKKSKTKKKDPIHKKLISSTG